MKRDRDHRGILRDCGDPVLVIREEESPWIREANVSTECLDNHVREVGRVSCDASIANAIGDRY